MKNILYAALLLLSSCASKELPKQETIIYDLDRDFPVTDTLTGVLRQTFSISRNMQNCYVEDTVLYFQESNPDNFGHCYSINSGNEITTLIGLGRATNEITRYPTINWGGDSIQFVENFIPNRVKLVAKNDILTKSQGERKVTTYVLPEGLNTSNYIKLDNEAIFGSYSALYSNREDSTIYFIYKDGDLSFFGNVNMDLYEATPGKVFGIADIKLHSRGSGSPMIAKGDSVIIAENQGIYLSIIDAAKKSICTERCYNKYEISENTSATKNRYYTMTIGYNEVGIFCIISKQTYYKLNGENKSVENYHVLSFDWKLNPLKKYYIPKNNGLLSFDKDCKSIYFFDTSDEEKQELYEYKL